MPCGVYKRTNKHRLISIGNLGIGMLGKKFSQTTKDKISKANKGNPKLVGKRHSPKTEFKKGILSTPKPFKKGHVPWNKGKKIYYNRGKNNSNWKGGITPFLRMLRTTFEYRQWRSDVYTRDNFTCVNCGREKTNIHADHIKMFAEILREYKIKTYQEAIECPELWNINNGQTLCEDCHDKKTKVDLKRNWGFRKSVGKLPKQEAK